MKTKTRKGVTRRLYGLENSARSRDLPSPRYYVRMRLLKNLLWMFFIVLLLAILFLVHTAERGSGGEAGLSRDSVETGDH
jgi:uncharacterized membrane protein